MTENQIERRTESMINSLDRTFMNTSMSQEEYDSKMAEIRKWADTEYAVQSDAERAGFEV
jgi:hypothetical protein